MRNGSVVRTSPASRLPFLAAVALIGAALGDPLVESISNTGIVGGAFADDNHLSVVPTLILGVTLACTIAAKRCIDLWRHAGPETPFWLRNVAASILERPVAQDVPLVLGMQLAAVFLMENAERVATAAGQTSGADWLGAPIAFSISCHLLIAVACTAALGSFMRRLLSRFASLLSHALEYILLAVPRANADLLARREHQHVHRAQTLYARQIGGRAPPLLPLFAT